ncbi:MAG: hypothetical protein L0G57_11040 [Acinetobacter sp.]|nr:hypothetical protein [Acinetobacter sp.]
MDIVKIIDQHSFALRQAIEQASLEQRKSLVKAVFAFFEKLPTFQSAIEQNYQIKIDKKQLFHDIDQENLIDYQKQIRQLNALVDEYADDYEELAAIEVISLDAFFLMVSNQNKSQHLVALFNAMIEVLDYYENFSENSIYWNEVLEKEILLQEQIIKQIATHIIFDESIYCVHYQTIEFPDLD